MFAKKLMPSTNTFKLIRSLEQKKFRQEHGLFVVEGKKSISELLKSDFIKIRYLYLIQNQEIDFPIPAHVTTEYISQKDLNRMSLMTSPDFGLAVAEIPDTTFIPELRETDFFPVLDSIRDPGNLGTINQTL
jgi:TrmH family RNA methyltransferase